MCFMYITLLNPDPYEEDAIFPNKVYRQKVKQFLCDFGLGKDFLDIIPKTEFIKVWLIRLCQIENFDPIKKKDKPQTGRKYLENI